MGDGTGAPGSPYCLITQWDASENRGKVAFYKTEQCFEYSVYCSSSCDLYAVLSHSYQLSEKGTYKALFSWIFIISGIWYSCFSTIGYFLHQQCCILILFCQDNLFLESLLHALNACGELCLRFSGFSQFSVFWSVPGFI